MSMDEAIEIYGPDAGSNVSSLPAGSSSSSTVQVETPAEPTTPAYLPLSEDVSGSVVTRHSKRIWHAADFFNAKLSLDAYPFRLPWNQETLREIIKTSLRASPRVDPMYVLKFITIPNR